MSGISVQAFLFSVFGISVTGLILQIWYLTLPLSDYIFLVIMSTLSLVLLVFRVSRVVSECLALGFATVFGLTFLLSTHFTVLAYGDPYGQLLVLRELASSSHIATLSFSTPIVVTKPYSTYVGWPGIQIVGLAFSDLTGFPLLQTSMILSIAFFVFLTLASLALAKSLFGNIAFPLRNFPTLVVLITAFSQFFDTPPLFKYNIPADVMLICGILILLESYIRHTNKHLLPLVILTAGIGLTHSVTSFVWVFFVLLVLGGSFFQAAFSRYLHHTSRYLPILTKSSRILWAGVVVVTVTVVIWVSFGFVVLRSLPFYVESLLHPFSIAGLGISPFATSILTSLTPSWIISLLYVRNVVFLSSFVVGLVTLLMRPRLFGDSTVTWFLILAGTFSAGTALFSAIFPGYYGLTLLTALDMILCLTPFIYLASKSKLLVKFGVFGLITLFLMAGLIGLWGNSYAPVYIYDKSVSPASFGEHPTTWPIASTFVTNTTNPSCILSNEVYVTALGLPISDLNSLYGLWNLPLQPNCIVIDYPLLNASTSYVTEVVNVYQGFSYNQTYAQLNLSDKILAACVASADCPQIYYIQ